MSDYIICSGFGGQGVMSMGQILAYSGMIEKKEVSWLPSYGPEMRGGTANCSIIISDESIASPVITNNATVLVAMNLPSLLKFESSLISGGVLLINSSLIKEEIKRNDVKVYKIPVNELALEKCKNPKVANMIMLGAYMEISRNLDEDSLLKGFLEIFGKKKADLLPLNKSAIEIGAQYVREVYGK